MNSEGSRDPLTGRRQARGEPSDDVLFPVVYNELRRLARHYLRSERSGHTLQATALVHEAYLRLAGQGRILANDRTHFFALAARTMRRVLVDYARQHRAEKRGPSIQIRLDDYPEGEAPSQANRGLETDLVDLDIALSELGELDSQLVRIVEARYFAGMTIEEAADVMGISPATAKRAWATARAWLFARLTSSP